MTTKVLDAARLITDDPYFYEHMIVIEDRHRNLISFTFNPAQEILYNNSTPKDLVVKAGQMGITTFYLAKFFKDTITIPGTTSVVVAHEEFLTQRLLNRTEVWYNHIPDVIQVQLPDGTSGPMKKSRRSHSSANEKKFPDINSVFYIGTARAFVFGRGEPIHNFLGSEVAFWPDAWRILTPTIQRVPLGTGSMVLESTPNGEDNAFFELVNEALYDPDSLWRLHQLFWWLEPSYRLPRGAAEARQSDRALITNWTIEELDLINRVGWDDIEADERIRWRRMKIAGVKEMFWQEFIEDISSCFLTNQLAYYDSVEIDRMRSSISPFQFIWNKAEIWNAPDEDWETQNYVISVDPGQGKHTLSVALVWRLEMDGSVRHEASLSGLYDSVTFAPMVKELGYYYGTAKIIPERNGHGLAFTAQVADYPNLYTQTDIVSGVPSRVIGWATTGALKLDGNGTKTYMLDELSHLLSDMECRDINVIDQLSRVRVGADKKITMPKMDDFHDAAAIMAATRHASVGMVASGLAFKKGWRW